MDRPARLFVYGTLMPGWPLWPSLAPFAVSWARASAPGRLWDTGHGFPCIRFDAQAPEIPGVLVEIAPARLADALAMLDRIEDEGRLYRRVLVTTSGGSAFAYEWLGPTEGLVSLPDGWPVSPPGR
jgi:gamma-glutamylcyclotransferase (GGCT)/AIG2-like uncharacterized protein YtfP